MYLIYISWDFVVGIGGKSQRGLFVELTLAFGDPALDEEYKIDESDNDEISSLSDQFFWLWDH